MQASGTIAMEDYIDKILKLVDDEEHRNEKAYMLFSLWVESLSHTEDLHFSSLYTRIAYLGQKGVFNSTEIYQLHQCRKLFSNLSDTAAGNYYIIPLFLILRYAAKKVGSSIPDALQKYIERVPEQLLLNSKPGKYYRSIDALLYSLEESSLAVTTVLEQQEDVAYELLLDQDSGQFDEFKKFAQHMGLPLSVSLLDVVHGEGQVIKAGAIVYQANYLVDVSSIASCFDYKGSNPANYLLNKLLPRTDSIHILLGNIANALLDIIISEGKQDFKLVLMRLFRLFPLSFLDFEDRDLRAFVVKIQEHFTNLENAVNNGLPKENISPKNVYLEPAFFAPRFGIQGRLDVFSTNESEQLSTIIELKSGKQFRPNSHGINAAHYIQTLLYDLMIKAVYRDGYKNANYILYSKLDNKALKYAPAVKQKQYEALRLRNQLCLYEHLLESIDQDDNLLLEGLDAAHWPDQKGFSLDKVKHFEKIYGRADGLSKRYYLSFLAFTAHEHHLAKIGQHGEELRNGLASLWLNDPIEKKARFEYLNKLKIQENKSDTEMPIIEFYQEAQYRYLSSFRRGDIAVLYPDSSGEKTVLHNQVFKCNVLEVSDQRVSIKLRSRQNNQKIFEQNEYWCLEPDFMDSSFNLMYRGLFSFLEMPHAKQELILTTRRPKSSTAKKEIPDYQLSKEQTKLLSDMIHAPEYYLLWGPPGTGKTSYMLKYYTKYIYEETSENILLLAYTNRAVDEICASISTLGVEYKDRFIRIGSSISAKEQYRPNLLSNIMSQATRRSEIKEKIKSTRIYMATVSSMYGKPELFRHIHFASIIIDEASQILEPMLLDIFGKVPKFILVGDHNQLPAVVVQPESKSKVEDSKLRDIGLIDRRDSLFERMYVRATDQQWTDVYGIIAHQGRMHQEIMQFPNQQFYHQQLKTISELSRLGLPIAEVEGNFSPFATALLSYRCLYLPTRVDEEINIKTNIFEALQVSKIISILLSTIYAQNPLTRDSIGVITPYRAQIALIKKQLQADDLPVDQITIDTVERYQGGARDIIILSLCTNDKRQLRSLSSNSRNGVNRKLNVAITRAREKIIVLGNRDVLSLDPNYKALIEGYRSLG